jgi:hypothetical protein
LLFFQYGKLISLWLCKVEVFLPKSSPYVTKYGTYRLEQYQNCAFQ